MRVYVCLDEYVRAVKRPKFPHRDRNVKERKKTSFGGYFDKFCVRLWVWGLKLEFVLNKGQG